MTHKEEKTSLDIGVSHIKAVVKTLTKQPGVYRMLNDEGDVLYIGKAKHLKNRVISYTKPEKLPNRLKRMVAETRLLEVVTTESEIEALLLESNLIKTLKPKYNVLLKDDKSFPYIFISGNHVYPRIAKHRGVQAEKGTYFGPFASASAVEETNILLQKVFQLRNCSDSFFAARTRPCLQYHIKRCTAPCVAKVTPAEYQEQVSQAIMFLNGKSDAIQKYLAEKMQIASDQQRYEEAALYRDKIRLLIKIQAYQRVNPKDVKEADVIAIKEQGGQTCVQVFFFRNSQNYGTESFFLTHTKDVSLEEQLSAFISQFYEDKMPPSLILLSHCPVEASLIFEALSKKHERKIKYQVPKLGEKKSLVDHALNNAKDALDRRLSETETLDKIFQRLAEIFELSEKPKRIEVYDNSHLQGTNPYGVMVVAGPKGFEKKLYRKFSIKESQPAFGGDDFAMMREVLKRRFARSGEENWDLPDLILIDGGMGQVNAVLQITEEIGIENAHIVGIAKGPDRNAGRERFFVANKPPFSLDNEKPVLHFLQRLRDEAHRFAIGTHRAGRQKRLIRSRLDDIPGIGPNRKKSLLQHFGSAQAISLASLQDIILVPGISRSVARKIYDYFHS